MSTLTELRIWQKWLNNYQAYQGTMTVSKAYELARVLHHAESTILDQQTELDILRTKEAAHEDRL